MDAVDSYIPEPERDIDKPFLMAVEDVFSIKGRGTVVTGRIERGIIKVGDEVEILGVDDPQKTTVTGVEMFRKLLDQGQAGDNVGCLLRGIDKEQVERGQVLATPGSVNTHTQFECEVYILSKDEGGRHKPFFELHPSVLHPHAGRDGQDRASGRREDGHAWRQREDEGQPHHAGSHGREAALRDSRGRPNHRCRRHFQDH